MSLSKLDTETIVRAFEVMGAYLRDRNLIGEIAVYGGTAILLQFPWRTATDDVDAVFSSGEAEASMKDAAAYAATLLRLPDDWLNNAVGGFPPESELDDFFLLQVPAAGRLSALPGRQGDWACHIAAPKNAGGAIGKYRERLLEGCVLQRKVSPLQRKTSLSSSRSTSAAFAHLIWVSIEARLHRLKHGSVLPVHWTYVSAQQALVQ